MLHIDNLDSLFLHRDYLFEKMPGSEVFFVGGCVRDLLLGIVKHPKDIDLTMGGTPEQIWESIVDTDISRFKTDKFGTITIIPKHDKQIQYEITPFRTEGGYDDYRHPTEITRSNDLLSDSDRRDFTINCIYRHGTDLPARVSPKKKHKLQDPDQLMKILEDKQIIYLGTEQVLIVQHAPTIKKLLKKGKLQSKVLQDILHAHPVYLSGKASKSKKLSIIIDPQGGINDITTRTLRAVGDPHQRFGEDALRIIRGPRFVNILNHKIQGTKESENFFDFETNTWMAMKKNYYLVSYVAKERIKAELEKVFTAADPFGFIGMLDELHILGILFPAFANCKQVEQPVRYHPFDVYNHTLLTLHELQKINKNRLVRMAMVYHDVGKPEQYHFYSLHIQKDEKKLPVAGHMYHTNIGVELVHRDFAQLGFSKKEIEEISRYVKRHHRPGELLDGKPENMPKKLRKIISQVGHKRLLNLIDVAIADRLGMYNPVQPPAIQGLKDMKKLVRKLYKEEGRFTINNLAVNGDLLMKEFKLSPGPTVGEYLNAAFNRAMENVQERNHKKKLLSYLKQTMK